LGLGACKKSSDVAEAQIVQPNKALSKREIDVNMFQQNQQIKYNWR
jgi:ABC-type metal ion transport system substrate-binding protein